MAEKNQWVEWLRCNVLELAILILLLVLVVKVFSTPAIPVTEETSPVGEIMVEEPLVEEAAATEEVVPVVGVPVEEAPATG